MQRWLMIAHNAPLRDSSDGGESEPTRTGGIASRRGAGYSSGKHYHSGKGDRQAHEASRGSTVIGRSVTIRGELSGNEDLYMDGIVEGTITLPGSRLTVGPNARVMADLDARDVVIYGFVEGNIRATGRIELRESAEVQGDIAAERLSIEENASIKGRVELTEIAPEAEAGRQANGNLFAATAPTSTVA